VIVGTRWAGFGILCRPGPGHRAWCHSFGVFCHSAGRRLDQTARPAVIGQRLPWSRSGFAGPRIHQTVGSDRGVNRANPVTNRPAVLTASRVARKAEGVRSSARRFRQNPTHCGPSAIDAAERVATGEAPHCMPYSAHLAEEDQGG
jgi:hypothetical protein